jgi:integrase
MPFPPKPRPPIDSWQEFDREVQALKPRGRWIFRGVLASWKEALTSLDRVARAWNVSNTKLPTLEYRLTRDFRRHPEGADALGSLSNDIIYVWALMQHHGAPTRLMDWTYSPYVAAFFAFDELIRKKSVHPAGEPFEEQAVVWALNTKWLNEALRETLRGEKREKYEALAGKKSNPERFRLAITKPPFDQFICTATSMVLNQRLSLQQGVFLCPGDVTCSWSKNLDGLGWTPEPQISKAFVLNIEPTDAYEYLNRVNVTARNLFPEVVGDRRLKELSPFHLEKWKASRAKDVSQSTVNRELNIVRGCFSRAVEWDRLGKSPARSVKPYRVDNVRLRLLTDAEAMRLLSEDVTAEAFKRAVEKKTRTRLSPAFVPDLQLMARTTLVTLMRLSEVLALRRDDITTREIVVVNSKSGKGRKVPVPPHLRTLLLERCHSSGYVFGRGDEGQPPTAAMVSVAFARWAALLKLSGVSHHTCRHTGASNMLRDGASPRAVQLIGGWTSLRMVERYCHVTDEELHKAVSLANSHTGTNAGTAGQQRTHNAETKATKTA